MRKGTRDRHRAALVMLGATVSGHSRQSRSRVDAPTLRTKPTFEDEHVMDSYTEGQETVKVYHPAATCEQ